MKKILILLLVSIVYTTSFSQEKTLNKITKFKIKNSGAIMDKNNDVDGYFFFYEVDKLKKGKREFAIQILDNNLNVIAKKSYIDHKRTVLANGKFNNQKLMFATINLKEKKYKLITFDKKGNKEKDIVIDVTGKEMRWLNQMMKMGDFNMLYPIDNKGFLFNYIKYPKKLGYALKYVATDGGKSWDYFSPKNTKKNYIINPIEANEEVIVALEGSKKSMLSRTINYKIIVIDVKTGKLLFEKDYDKKENPRLITKAFLTDDKKLVLLGEYFEKGKNVMSSKSLGLFAQITDLKGEVLSDKKVSWVGKIDVMMPPDIKGKKRKSEYTFFHDMVRTKDGSYYCIGEKFRKTVSAVGVAAVVLGGNAPVTQLSITDAVVFKFDKNFDLEDIKVFRKGKSRAPSVTDFGSAQLNAHALNALGAFDYEFTQVDKEKDRFYAAFIDYERIKGETNKLAFKAIIYNDGELTEDKIYLSKNKRRIKYRVFPGKLGSVLLLEYKKKEKTVHLHLEKLNL